VSLGSVGAPASVAYRTSGFRWLLPLGLAMAAVGYYGPWIAHVTAALTLSGVDMGEFIKFLPGVLDGSLHVVRQFYYLVPLAVVVNVALLAGSRQLRYPWPARLAIWILAWPVSLQLLPPAWSLASLATAEFRLQAVALGACWILLAAFWLLGRLPLSLTGPLSATLSLAAGAMSFWQFLLTKPAIDQVYRQPPAVGWGFTLCLAGLAVMAVTEAALALQVRRRGGGSWTSR
jgi:hypothetical protein